MEKIINSKKNRINLNPKGWGDKGWQFIISTGIGYPLKPTKEEKDGMRDFINSLSTLLPCMKCRFNYSNHLKKHPIDDNALSDRVSLLKWMVKLKNEVNKSLGKPEYSEKETIDYYYNLLLKTKKSDDSDLLILCSSIGVLLFVFLLYRKMKN